MSSGTLYPPPYPAVLPIFNPENYLYKDQVLTLAMADMRYVKKGFLSSGGGWGDYLYWNGTKWASQNTRILMGRESGQINQADETVAIGYLAGKNSQKIGAVAVGRGAGYTNQRDYAVALGYSAGNSDQGVNSVAIGFLSGTLNQGAGSVSIGIFAGNNNQGAASFAMGNRAGENFQGFDCVAIGEQAGRFNQGNNSVAIGNIAGSANQASNAIAIGNTAGSVNQASNAIAIGNAAGNANQYNKTIALGFNAGYVNQGTSSISIGDSAGNVLLGENGISIGKLSGSSKTIYSNTDQSITSITPSGDAKYLGGVLAPNGKIYCAPYQGNIGGLGNIRDILVIDTSTNTRSFLSVGGGIPSNGVPSFVGQVLAPNGKIYCIPHGATIIPIIDPVAGTVDTTTMTGLPTGLKYWGGVLAPNGKIYGIPYNSNNVLVIDPTTNTYTTFGSLPAASEKFRGGVLAPNGKIYCVPYSNQYQFIAQIDPTTNTIDTSFSFSFADYGAYGGGILANNNKIYCIGAFNFTTPNILIIDPSNNTTDTTSISGFGVRSSFGGSVALGEDGKIYVPDVQSTNIWVIDPNTNTQTLSFPYTDTSGGAGINLVGAVAYKSGSTCRIYFPPYRGTVAVFIFGTTIGSNMISIGTSAGEVNQSANSIAIGSNAGRTNQNVNSIAIGINAGAVNQLNSSVAVGEAAGQTSQNVGCVAVGSGAGQFNQSVYSTSIGIGAGRTSQGGSSVAVGRDAGSNNQGQNAIAIGYVAGLNNQHTRSIILNASGTTLDSNGTDRCFINPVGNATTGYLMGYNRLTKEVANYQATKYFYFTYPNITVASGTTIDMQLIFSSAYNFYRVRINQWIFPNTGYTNPNHGATREVIFYVRRNPTAAGSGGSQSSITTREAQSFSTPTLGAVSSGIAGAGTAEYQYLSMPWTAAVIASTTYSQYYWVEMTSPLNDSLVGIQYNNANYIAISQPF